MSAAPAARMSCVGRRGSRSRGRGARDLPAIPSGFGRGASGCSARRSSEEETYWRAVGICGSATLGRPHCASTLQFHPDRVPRSQHTPTHALDLARFALTTGAERTSDRGRRCRLSAERSCIACSDRVWKAIALNKVRKKQCRTPGKNYRRGENRKVNERRARHNGIKIRKVRVGDVGDAGDRRDGGCDK